MHFHFKFIVFIFAIAFCKDGHSYTKELSIDQIYQFRSKKVKKSRQFYGKKLHVKLLEKDLILSYVLSLNLCECG